MLSLWHVLGWTVIAFTEIATLQDQIWGMV